MSKGKPQNQIPGGSRSSIARAKPPSRERPSNAQIPKTTDRTSQGIKENWYLSPPYPAAALSNVPKPKTATASIQGCNHGTLVDLVTATSQPHIALHSGLQHLTADPKSILHGPNANLYTAAVEIKIHWILSVSSAVIANYMLLSDYFKWIRNSPTISVVGLHSNSEEIAMGILRHPNRTCSI